MTRGTRRSTQETSEQLATAVGAAGVSDRRVLDAVRHVPRSAFVPGEHTERAYRDEPIPIPHDQVTTQPSLSAKMIEALGLSGQERVLEIGTGSGYAAAVLSRCCGEVVTIERHASLAERARDVLGELGYANVEVRTGDGTRGAPDRAPFGGIVVAATAPGGPPPALLEQLAPGAALVCPVDRDTGEHLMRFRDGEEEAVASVRFVPLVSDEDDG